MKEYLCIDKFSNFSFYINITEGFIEFLLNDKIVSFDCDNIDIDRGTEILDKLLIPYFNQFEKIQL